MIYTTIPTNLENVVYMRNPFRPLFASENKEDVLKRNNMLADFYEKHSDIFPFCTLCNLKSIEELRKSPYDGNLSNIGFGTLFGKLCFFACWVHPDSFTKNPKEVKSIDEFLKLAQTHC